MKTKKTHSLLDIDTIPVGPNSKKLKARWTRSVEDDIDYSIKPPTQWERLRYKWYSKIPTSCMCGEVHPSWKYVKKAFVFIFGRPDGSKIMEYEHMVTMSNSIRDEIDKEIIAELRVLADKKAPEETK